MSIERILVLEDDESVSAQLVQQLAERHYDVLPVATLAAAHEVMNRRQFDLIIAAVRLGDGAGRESS